MHLVGGVFAFVCIFAFGREMGILMNRHPPAHTFCYPQPSSLYACTYIHMYVCISVLLAAAIWSLCGCVFGAFGINNEHKNV